MVEGNFSGLYRRETPPPPVIGLLLAPRVAPETSPFPRRPMPAGHSWGQPEVLAEAKAWNWPTSRASTPCGLSRGVSEAQDFRREDKAPNIRLELEKPEKTPGTADSGRHVLEAAAPSPTLAVP